MDVFEAIRTRRSIRKYLDKPVERENIERVLEAARLAPSGANRQTWKFIVVEDVNMRQALAMNTRGHYWVARAPVIIAAVATDPTVMTGSREPAHRIDIAIALDHVTLAAHALGLGTCWIGAFDQRAAEDLLGVPDGMEVVLLMTLGYQKAPGVDRGRKPLSEIIAYEKFDGPAEPPGRSCSL